MSQMETLINTLLNNGLASSRSEAQRMANDMMSTSDKVNESMRSTGDNYMVSNFKENREPQQQAPTPSSSESPQEQQIEQLRANALNPQPIHVQTEFDTPATQKESLPNTEPIVQVQHSPEMPQAIPTMTPEEYAARQMTNLGATIGSDLTSEPVQEQPIQSSSPASSFSDEPVEFNTPSAPSLESGFSAMEETPLPEQLSSGLAVEPPRDFISAEPIAEVAPPMQSGLPSALPSGLEPTLPVQEEEEVQEEHTREVPIEDKKRSGFNEQEKKLAEEVDLSKVFNFSNR